MKNKILWLLICTMPMVAACAIGYTRVAKAPDAPLRNYKIIEIPDLAGSDQIPAEVKNSIPNQVAEELGKEKLFAKVERSDAGKGESIVLLSGRVIQYNPGSRGMRYLTGPLWGVGKGSIIVNVKFIEKDSRKELADSSFEGEIKGGLFGGGIDETYKTIADEIVHFIKSNY
jgi:hypothetical protein